jgi:8-oxo-dGTP pyrophosphatase MutT (NUDIX family)
VTGEEIQKALRSHLPLDGKEARDLQAMRRYAGELAAPTSRDQPEAHFTASALVVDPSGEHVALIHHRKIGRWLQPGGHVEPDDATLADGALREAREELGIEVSLHPTAPRPLDVDVHEFPAREGKPAHLHLDVRFLLVAAERDLAHDAAEAHGATWFAWDDALAIAGERPLARMLEKARAIVRPRREEVLRLHER